MRHLAALIAIGATIATAAPLASVQFREPQASVQFRELFYPNQATITLTDLDFAKPPRWSPAEPSPPLSPREALRLANQAFTALLPEPTTHWRLDALWLVPFPFAKSDSDTWYWRARYTFTGNQRGQPRYVSIVILMDGSVITPKIEEAPSP